MVRVLVALVVLGGCFRVGPVKVGLLPSLPNDQRDPDRTRNFIHEPSQPDGEGGVTTAGEDPLSVGPLSGGVSLTTYALSRLAGLRAYFGVYGVFDETGLVELDPEKREKATVRTQAEQAAEGSSEP